MNPKRTTPNPWPIALIAFFILFIGATAGLVLFSTFHRMELVDADYYEHEINHQSQMERVSRTRQRHAQVQVDYQPDQHSIQLGFPSSHVDRGAVGTIHLYRPSAARLDRTLPIKYNAQGKQLLDTEGLRPGLWRIRILWTSNQEEYFDDQRLLIVPAASS
ncbi:MAG: FixH family protein [Verrucomicrobia bacterium]|nr:FixH family protein [Verrucomicrobiota bacterium]